MNFEARFDIFAIFMLLGISQGFLLVYFFLFRKHNRTQSDFFYGLFLVTIIILSSEILLNYTGLIVKVIRIENYSEAFIFLIMPLLFLIIKTRLNEAYSKEDNIHFFPFFFYFLYCVLYFVQPKEFKYNSYVYCYQPDWISLHVNQKIPDDPLGLRQSLPQLYISQGAVYLYLILNKLKTYPEEIKFGFFRKKTKTIRPLFAYWYHALAIILLIIFIKIYFERDLGDFIIGTYISIVLYVSGFITLSKQFSHQNALNDETAKAKYEKSSLSESKKEEIVQKIKTLLSEKKFFTRNTLSLSETAKAINEPAHHVSQSINEKLGKSFYDLLSAYRIDEAKSILQSEVSANITIEEIAEQVGYNSKAAFNKAFKNHTGQTPSEFRKNLK